MKTHPTRNGVGPARRSIDLSRIGANSIWCLTAALLVGTVGTASPPSDLQLEDAIATYERRMKEVGSEPSDEVRAAIADQAIAPINLGEMSLAQIEAFMEASELYFYTSRRDELDKRLVVLGEARSAAGARALMHRLELLSDQPRSDKREMIEMMLNHPSLAVALRDGELWSSFMVFEWYVEPEDVRGLEPQLVGLGEHIPEKLPMLGVLGAVDIFEIVAKADPAGYERREPLRLAVGKALRRLAQYVDPDEPSLQKWNFARDIPGYIRNEIARVEGPAIRGSLIGGPAPDIDFIWVSGDRKIESLSELRGKVVVLDFWATWCGPCVASFPKTKELVARYRDHSVEIIGVTSIQGAHVEFGEAIDCKDDPAREMELMADYVKRRKITWNVAFSRQPVYNPSYNIRGIPQLVLIDARGHVRYRGLHPHTDHERAIDLIDGLLREAGIKPPPPIEHEEMGEHSSGNGR